MMEIVKRVLCFLSFGHRFVMDSWDVEEMDMHCEKCGFHWNLWNNIGAL